MKGVTALRDDHVDLGASGEDLQADGALGAAHLDKGGIRLINQ